uniref:uncharacterized protein LOC120346317 n=1 Tax=Styela clava TaxID=7725 RepID=UPI00193A8114|nr:uncharacterized protein LOC120346317 [Styela clava]
MLLNKKIVSVVILVCVVCLATSQDCQARYEVAAKWEDPTRVCRKGCVNDADCSNANHSCLCDDLCGLSCFNPDDECPDLTGTLANGVVWMPDGRKYYAKAKHTCNDGYYRVGIEKRICRSTRKWSHVQANCTRGCAPPPTASGAYADTDPDILGYQPGETVTYVCNTGFEGAGDFNVTCQADYEWSTVQFYCAEKNCGVPPTIYNGGYRGTSFLFGNTIYYYCNTGYDISGTAVRRCMADGIWIPEEDAPTCMKNCECIKFEQSARYTDLRDSDLQHSRQINELIGKYEEQSTEIGELRKINAEQSSEIRELKKDLIEVQERNDELEGKLNEQNKTNIEMKNAISRIEQKMVETEKSSHLRTPSRQIPKTTTITQTTLRTTFPPENCELKIENICYFAVLNPTQRINYSEAFKICKKRNADVGSIRDEESNNAIMDYLRRNIPTVNRLLYIWTGIHFDPMTRDVTPADSFIQWYSSYPNTGIDHKDFSNVYFSIHVLPTFLHQGMGNTRPTRKMQGVICEILIQ